MNTTTTVGPKVKRSAQAQKILALSSKFWFSVMIIGQWMFVYFIVSFYWGTFIQGEKEKWNEHLYVGLVEGDFLGNFMLIFHLFLAGIITFGGPLQFIPQIRKVAPTFHRWNGRIYILTAILISIAGLYMVHTRTIIGGTFMKIGNTINASLIIGFAILAWRTAVARDFVAHRRWALRTFIAACGVWFIRVGFGLWIFLNGGSAPGSNETMTGPFDTFLALAHTLLPLAILEIYLYAKESKNNVSRFAVAIGLFICTLLMGAGIFMASMIFW